MDIETLWTVLLIVLVIIGLLACGIASAVISLLTARATLARTQSDALARETETRHPRTRLASVGRGGDGAAAGKVAD